MAESGKGIRIKVTDDDLKGRYANLLRISHTREEFFLDFINVVPPQGVLTSRVVTSPGHLKRILGALRENLSRYEAAYGQIREADEPARDEEVN